MDLVFIYGPPASGKLTVATELAERTGYRLFHNHLSIDCALPVFDYGTRPYGRLVEEIRTLVLSSAAREGVSLVFTFVYKQPHDDGPVRRLCQAVEEQGGRVCPVQLTCPQAVLEQRVLEPARAEQGKIASVDVLRSYLAPGGFDATLPNRDSLSIDTSAVSPHEAAVRIAAHYGLPNS